MKKKILLILIILIIISIVIIIFLRKLNNKIDATPPTVMPIISKLQKEEDYTEYFTVKDIITKIFNFASELNKDEQDNMEYSKDYMEEYLNAIYYYYLEKMPDTYNLKEVYTQYANKVYSIENMYVYNPTEDIKLIYIEGQIENLNGSYPMVFLHNEYNFTVLPAEYLKDVCREDNIKDNLDKIKIDNISDKIRNKFVYSVVTEQEMAIRYFAHYKNMLKQDLQKAYELLDVEYRTKKYTNFEEFKRYIEENYDEIMNLTMKEYKVEYNSNYTKYTCKDQKGNIYIFKVTAVFEYTLITDLYTTDIPEFTKKYYNAEDTEKMALNIQKIFDAMNGKDYSYIYGKLSEGFKEKYFTTLEDFEKYVKNNFFEENEVDYLLYQKESEEYYSYTIDVCNKNTEDKKRIKIIMELKSGTDFVFSFNVE